MARSGVKAEDRAIHGPKDDGYVTVVGTSSAPGYVGTDSEPAYIVRVEVQIDPREASPRACDRGDPTGWSHACAGRLRDALGPALDDVMRQAHALRMDATRTR